MTRSSTGHKRNMMSVRSGQPLASWENITGNIIIITIIIIIIMMIIISITIVEKCHSSSPSSSYSASPCHSSLLHPHHNMIPTITITIAIMLTLAMLVKATAITSNTHIITVDKVMTTHVDTNVTPSLSTEAPRHYQHAWCPISSQSPSSPQPSPILGHHQHHHNHHHNRQLKRKTAGQ